MIDLLNLGRILKTIRYFIRPERPDDGTLLEQKIETFLNSDGIFQTTMQKGSSVLDCGHIVHDPQDIFQCPYCGSLNCLNQCTQTCEICMHTHGNCCTKIYEGQIVCITCYNELKVKKAVSLTCRATGKVLLGTTRILLSPFKQRSDG